jgi:hypothetical protein
VTFQTAVEATAAISGAYRKGLGALPATDRPHIEAEDTRRLTGSVNVDETLKDDFPNDHRWDYAIGHRPANLREEIVYWVEIHPATAGEVKVVLAKLQWLKRWLREESPRLNAMRREFIWVSSGKTSFTLSSTQQKQFALLGLQHKGRVLRIANEASA